MAKFLERFGSTIIENKGTAIIKAPIEQVWALVGSPEGISRWDPMILSMVQITDGPQQVGSRFRVRSYAGVGKKVNDRIEELIEYEPLACRVIHCEVPLMPYDVATRVERRGEFTLCSFHSIITLYGPWRLMAKIVYGFGEKNIHEALKAVKTFVVKEANGEV